MMRRFTSAPKPARRVSAYISCTSGGRRRAGRSGRRRSGPGSRRPRTARSGSRRPGRARRAAASSRRPRRRASGTARPCFSNSAATPGSTPAPELVARHREAQALQVGALGQHDRLGQADVGRVARVVAGDDAGQQRDVAHGVRERPDLVERRGEGDDAVARHGAVRRLQPDDAAERRRLADRAARVGAERPAARGRRRPPRPSRPTSRPARSARSHGLRVSW